MLTNEIDHVVEWFHVKSPSLVRCKEGDLHLELFQIDMYGNKVFCLYPRNILLVYKRSSNCPLYPYDKVSTADGHSRSNEYVCKTQKNYSVVTMAPLIEYGSSCITTAEIQ